MTEQEAAELISQAAERGLVVGTDSGFLIVTRSASADLRRDDEDEAEATIIRRLGKSMEVVRSFVMARVRGRDGSAFVGQQVYVPHDQVVGKFVDCSADGIVTVSYIRDKERERNAELRSSYRGDELFVIVDGDEQPDRNAPTSWIADEKLRLLFESAESVGLRLEIDGGFLVAKWTAIGTAERDAGESTLRRLGQSMELVRSFVMARARSRRGAAFVGQQVFIPELDVFGILERCSEDGVVFSYHDKQMGSLTCHCNGEALLVIVGGDEEPARASSADPKSKPTSRNWLRRAFGGFGG